MNDSPKVHLPGLNGIRAIAALAVIFSHIGLSLSYFGLENTGGIDLAGYGVTIFFALSGFLITYLLLVEKERFSEIGIRSFYMRRILRIWPLYYLYILLALVAVWLFESESLNSYLLFTVFFSANIPMILDVPMGIFGHFWSLGVEEQFYAFWPWVAAKVQKLEKWIIIFVCVLIVGKILAWMWFRSGGSLIPYSLIHVTRFHCMAIGGLAAVYFFQKRSALLSIIYHPAVQIICWLVIALLAFSSFPLPSVVKHEVVSLVAVVLIMNVAGNPRTLVRLRGVIPDYLGKISFGLYVYHPLIIFLFGYVSGKYLSGLDRNITLAIVYPVVLALTILVAGLSFEFFEKRFLKRKKAYSRVISQPGEIR